MKNKNAKIRILHVLTAMDRAGAETMLMNIYRKIDKAKIQFDFAVSADHECAYDAEIKALGGNIIRYPRYKIINHFQYKRWWKKFLENNTQYKVVHGHIGSTAAIYLKVAKDNGRIAVAHSHSVGMIKSLRDILYRIYSFRTRYVADYFLACSNAAMVSRYGKKIAKNIERSYVLKNGIDLQNYTFRESMKNKMREEMGLEKELFLVGTVGRFTYAKNPFFIVDIVNELSEKCNNFKFIWVGVGELKAKVEDYIVKKKLSNKIILLGSRDDVPNILQALDVFILPSKFEGLPVVGVEAQATGLRTICSDRVSPEIVLTKCCTILPIDSAKRWSCEILEKGQTRHIRGSHAELRDAGYDIRVTADWVTNFYLSKYKIALEKK